MAKKSDRDYPTPEFWDSDWGEEKSKKKREEKDEEKEVQRLIKVVVFTAVSIILIFFNPIGNPIKELVDSLVPNNAWIFYAIVVIFLGLMINSIWEYSSNFVGISYILLLLVLIIASKLAITWFQTPFGQELVLKTRCSISALFSPGTDITECISILPGSSEEDTGPIQTYDAIDVSADDTDSEYAVYRTESGLNFKSFLMFVTVENPSETRTVENFKILSLKSVIRKGWDIPTSKKTELANLKTSDGKCMDDSPCTLEPGDSISIVLKAEEIGCDYDNEIGCKSSDVCEWDESSETCSANTEDINEVEAKVTYSYDYAADGERELLLTKDYETYHSRKDTIKTPDTISYGPVYLKISFAPSYYVFDEDDETDIIVSIKLTNEKEGAVYLSEPIELTWISGESLLEKPSSCTDPLGDPATLDENGNILLKTAIKIQDSATFMCSYKVYGSSVREAGELVKADALAKYTYEDSEFKKFVISEF